MSKASFFLQKVSYRERMFVSAETGPKGLKLIVSPKPSRSTSSLFVHSSNWSQWGTYLGQPLQQLVFGHSFPSVEGKVEMRPEIHQVIFLEGLGEYLAHFVDPGEALYVLRVVFVEVNVDWVPDAYACA
jgi:hypothetical protein